jgi:hypothetical protein
MLVWVEGGLNPNEIKKRALSIKESDVDFGRRLLAFLDDTISNPVPEDPALSVPSNIHHPCSVRGMPVGEGSFTAQCQKPEYCITMSNPHPLKDLFQILARTPRTKNMPL